MSSLPQLLGKSPGIVAIREQVVRLLERYAKGARRLPPILLLGETGTGKGLLAAAVHRTGPRAGGPFVDVNCAAIPETLLEAELFGFERGAFTDARQAKAGLFQAAHRGTIFLDEIGLLPEALQGKFLKVIEEQLVRRLGGTRSEPVDVWVVAATSEDLLVATRARRFREDLYHRLAVLTFRLPPLRERGDDILLLAEHFLAQACEEYGLVQKALAPEARSALRAYPWPGNVRELANVIERVTLLTDAATLTPDELRLPPVAPISPRAAGGTDERRALQEAVASDERERLLEALRATTWNVSRAAARLGIPRNTLRYRMEKHGLGLGSPASPTPARHQAPEPASDTAAPDQAPGPVTGQGRRPVAVHWEPRRLALLRAGLAVLRADPSASDAGRAIEICIDKVRSFGGRVEELSGTGIVASFGTEPVEDAPRRAAYTALAIRKVLAGARSELPARPAVVLTIHVDQLLVGHIGGEVQIDADAKRTAWTVLDALAAATEPGAVGVSSSAASFLRRRFELEPLASGAGGLGPVYRLADRVEAERDLTRFVGRDPELRLLGESFERALAGHGQVVLIVGEPGIGKSRLLREFRRRLAGAATWVEGQATPYGRSAPFHPLIDMLWRTSGIDEADSETTVVEKLERHVLRCGEDLHPALPFLRYLLSVDPGDPTVPAMDPKLRKAGMFDAMRRFLQRASERRPQVVVCEDLHWADQATEEFLALMADGIPTSRVLLLLTYRPGYSPPTGDRTFHTRLALPTLSAAASSEMARALLAVDELPEELKGLIVGKAEGNPFFVEEVVRSLQEDGAVRRVDDRLILARRLHEMTVPDTIEDVIWTRIERLGPGPKAVLQVASVIGREFTRHLLDAVVDGNEDTEASLRELRALELVYDKHVAPELAYTFKHALTQEVAYRSLLPERRRTLHRRIGLAVEALYGDRSVEHADALAHHFSRAGEWPKALEYLLRAADRASRTFVAREALALYDEALEVFEQQGAAADPRTAMAIHEAKSALYFVVSDFEHSRAEGERLLDLARRTGDRPREAAALAAIAWASTWARDLDGAVTYARQAIEVAEPAGAASVAGRGYFITGFVRAVTGGLAEAREATARALAASQSAGDVIHQSLSLSVAGLLKNWEGEFGEAARLQTDALTIAREHNLLVPMLLNFFLRGLTLTGEGDYDAALATFHEGLALSERVGDEAIHHRLLNCLGWLHAELGDLDRAADLNQRSAGIGRKRSDPGTMPNAEINLGDIFMAKGDLLLAQELFDSAYRFWSDPATSEWMRWRYSIRLFASLGELSLARGDPARAQEFSNRCLDLATRTNSRKNLIKGWRLAGEIACARRQWDEAEAALRQALLIAQAIGNPTQLWKTHAALGRLQAAKGNREAAREAYQTTHQVINRIRANLRDPALRASFERGICIPRVQEFDLPG